MKIKELTKIDGPKKTIIRNDWLREFPGFRKKRECSIGKLVGPISVSIGWEIRYKEYRPGSSVCNLMNAEKNLYASLDYEPKSRRSDLTWEQHEKGLYKEAVAELKEYSPVPLEGPLTLSQLLEAYKKSLRPAPYPVYNNDPRLEDPVLIAAWAGKEKLAQEIALNGANFWKLYYKSYDDEKKQSIFLKIDEWHQGMLEKISDRQHLNVLIEEAIIKYKLSKLPYEDLIIDI